MRWPGGRGPSITTWKPAKRWHITHHALLPTPRRGSRFAVTAVPAVDAGCLKQFGVICGYDNLAYRAQALRNAFNGSGEAQPVPCQGGPLIVEIVVFAAQVQAL